MATYPDDRIRVADRMIPRAMTQDDVVAVHALSKAERWPHRFEDLADMLSVGEGVVGEVDGEIVASVMWWPAGHHSATLGMVIVAASCRGEGLGRLMMNSAIEGIQATLGTDAAILLNATEDGMPLYSKMGFVPIGDIRQHQGTSFSAPLVPLGEGERLRPVGENDAPRIAALIESATGLDRPAMMEVLFDKAHGVALDHDGELTGVALFRRFGHGYALGPVVAPDLDRAKALIAQWLGARSGEFTRLDIAGDSDLGEWLEDLGIVRVGRVVTMVRGRAPRPTGRARSFAIVAQALG